MPFHSSIDYRQLITPVAMTPKKVYILAWNNTEHCMIAYWPLYDGIGIVFYSLCPSHAICPSYVLNLSLRHHWNYLYHVHFVAIPINTFTVVFMRRSVCQMFCCSLLNHMWNCQITCEIASTLQYQFPIFTSIPKGLHNTHTLLSESLLSDFAMPRPLSGQGRLALF